MEKLLSKYLNESIKDLITPSYVFFESQLNKNIDAFKKFINSDIPVFYAVKANNYKPLLQALIKNGFGFDVASKEELELVISLGAIPERITFSAPSKKEEDIRFAAKLGIKKFAFDSEFEVQKIVDIVQDPTLFARVAVYSKDATFNLGLKFGMFENYFKYILRKSKINKWPLKGITFHVGSQNIAINDWKISCDHALKLISYAKKSGVQIEYLNMGGGIPAPYSKKIPKLDFYISHILSLCFKIKKQFPEIKCFVEPGRAICADTMALITSVIDIKPYKKPTMLVVNSGVFNGIIEPLEGFEYPIYHDHLKHKKKKYFRVAGFSCEGFDIISKKVLLPKNIQPGDVIIFMYAGAYTFVYEKFHMVSCPEIVNAQKKY